MVIDATPCRASWCAFLLAALVLRPGLGALAQEASGVCGAEVDGTARLRCQLRERDKLIEALQERVVELTGVADSLRVAASLGVQDSRGSPPQWQVPNVTRSVVEEVASARATAAGDAGLAGGEATPSPQVAVEERADRALAGLNTRMCVDSPADWRDSFGRDCHIYVQASFCTPGGGYGKLWPLVFGRAKFEDFQADNQTAVTACCGCGGGRACQDSPVGWTDKHGHGCATYLNRKWCSGDGGPGPGWPADWGSFEDQASNGHTAATACCECGPRATDAAGHGCEYYALNPTHCGCCDDEDFVAQILCAKSCSGPVGSNLSDILADWPNETRRIVIMTDAVRFVGVLGAEDWHARFPRLQAVSAFGFGQKLQGVLPAWMGLLQELQYVDLSSNWLTSSIPPEFGLLRELRVLNLGQNQLTGTVPSGLGNLRKLRHLRLQMNQLEGTLPPAIGDMTALQVLLMGDNGLTGTVPSEVGKLVQLQQLAIQSNQLTGTLPASLGYLKNLQELDVSASGLVGTLPHELGYLVKLRRLNVASNGFTGTIPMELGKLVALEELTLSSNRLSGTLPSEFGDLVELRVLLASGNLLVGTMPPEVGKLAKLQRMWVDGNQITGMLPSEFGNLTSLQQLYAQMNRFTGTLPKELGRLTELEELWLHGNQLTGMLPATLGDLWQLQSLSLHSNLLTGALPDTLGNATQLQSLYLQSNQLSGTLPSTLGQLQVLLELDLSDNRLAGTLPAALGRMAGLKALRLGGNCITGTLPVELGRLMSLQELDLSGNNFTGTLPTWSLPALQLLNVSNNRLTGQLQLEALGMRMQLDQQISPPRGGIFFLQRIRLDFSRNKFNGTLPSLVGHETVQHLNLSRNQLTGSLPMEWVQMGLLEELDASFNLITGTVPAEWAYWTASSGVSYWMHELRTLNLAENNLIGTLPAKLFRSMTALTALDLSSNNLAAIPGPPGEALRTATLHSNAFVGEAVNAEWFSVPTSLELWNNTLMRASVEPPSDACPWRGAAKLQADPYQWQDESPHDGFQCTRLCPGLQTHYKVDGLLNVSSLCRCKAGREGSGASCRGCPANTFSDSEDEWGMTRTCRACPARSTTDPWLENATSINDCKCQVGWYMPAERHDNDTMNYTGTAETSASTEWTCVRCQQHPFQTTAERGATLQSQCVCNSEYVGLRSLLGSCGCVDGSYMDHAHMRCTLCDQSAEECSWGVDVERSLQPPVIKAGYWAPAVPLGEQGGFSGNDIWRCVSADTCRPNSTCAAGRHGPACSLCEAGKHGGPDGVCVPCPAGPEQSRRALLWVLLIGPSAALAAHLLLQEGGEEKAVGAAQLLGSLRTSLKQCFKYLQMLGVVSTFSVRWPADARLFFTAVSRITVSLPQVAGAACLTGQQTATVEMVFRWLIPVAGLICAGLSPLLVNPLSWCWRRCWRRLRGHGFRHMGYWDVLRVSLWGLVLFYSTLLQFGTQILTCARSPNGKFTVLNFPHLVCLGTEEWARLALLSAAFLLVFVLALFVAIFLAWRRAVSALIDSSFRSRGWWGFLFIDFRDGCVHWVMLTMAKDVVLVAVATAGAGAGASQLLGSAAVCTFYSYLVLRDQPFREPANTVMEAWTAMSVAVLSVLSAGLGYQSSPQMDAVAAMSTNGGDNVLYDGSAQTMVAVQWVTLAGPVFIMMYQVVGSAERFKKVLPPALRPAGDEENKSWYADFFQAVGLDHEEPIRLRAVLMRFDLVDSTTFRNFMSSTTATLGLIKTTAGGINGAARDAMSRMATRSDSFMSGVLTGKERAAQKLQPQPPVEAEPQLQQAQPPAPDAAKQDAAKQDVPWRAAEAVAAGQHGPRSTAEANNNVAKKKAVVAL